MKKTVALIFLSLSYFLTLSCGGTVPATPHVDYIYEKDAIHLNLKADSQLNLFQGRAHTLAICLYQLRDPNSFNQLSQDQEGLYKLLECGRFDASVSTSKSLSIQPGAELKESLDRAEGAEYVAMAAGYFTLQKEHIVRLFKVPVIYEKKGWFRPVKIYKPGPLTIELLLGPQEIQDLGGEK